VLLRAGGLSREEIEAVVGPLEIPGAAPERPEAPGQLASHYAPRTKTLLLAGPASAGDGGRRALLAFREAKPGYAAVEILSPSGDLREAATRLFACLHRLDALGLDAITVEPVPEQGLGLAIMDRLRKAAA
jgi:L-threonylcarbamoyladenylate synthase